MKTLHDGTEVSDDTPTKVSSIGRELLTDDEIAAEAAKDKAWADGAADRAWKALRKKRDALLSETDYWGLSDITMTDEQKAYRQALRDLPATAGEPPVDDEDALAAWPTWPTKP